MPKISPEMSRNDQYFNKVALYIIHLQKSVVFVY